MVSGRYQRTLLLAATLLTSACGPTVRLSLTPNDSLPVSIAVLPADYAVEIPRERVDLVRNAIIHELRNKNFIVVENRVISTLCSQPTCPERARLAQDYLVDGFVTVSLASFSKNNFIAGYYNQLHGNVSIADTSGRELASVEHTENESGGVLLQSGQLFQGIISQVKHSGDSVFAQLADRFAKTVVERFPAPRLARSQPEGVELALSSVATQWSAPSSYTVCARGTPLSFAYLLLNRNRAALREVAPGSYCGSFSALVAADGGEAVELRSAFGNSVRQSLSLPTRPPCDLEARLALENGARATLACTTVGSDTSRLSKGCSTTLTPCSVEKVVLYEAPTVLGPYTKSSEYRSASLPIPRSGKSVAVIAISRGGVTSQPAPITTGR